MASKKQEIRKQLKKKEAKELEELGLNPNAQIVDLNDDLGEDVVVETFDDVVKKPSQPIEFNTTPQKEKKGFLGSIKKAFSQDNKIDESIFKAMLSKMGFSKLDFDTKIEEMSEGQKKKILIAKSISEQANIYIWDEPLNYIDILTREQIEDSILKYNPTLIFVEHDTTFVEKVATKIITIEK